MNKRKWDGDLVLVLDQFMGRDELGVIQLKMVGPGARKVFRFVDGKLVYPTRKGSLTVGTLVMIAHADADIMEELGELGNGKPMTIIPGH